MKAAIGRNWRDSASLIILAKRNVDVTMNRKTENSNFDVLLQTRTHSATFSNSIVFPGGVNEEADSSEHWLQLLKSFGYNQHDFEKLHKPGSTITPIFADNPVRRHISLRITAIRETFEELGLLLSSSEHKQNRSGIYGSVLSDVDVQYWRDRVAKTPLEFLNLCKELHCYPDIWSLHYWSNWLTPIHFPKRFDTAFFITALEPKPTNIKINNEVDKVEWAQPSEIIIKNVKSQVQLYPPQGYEFYRLSHFKDIKEIIEFAKERSCHGNELIFGVNIKTKDGVVSLLPGDHLYPSDVNYTKTNNTSLNKTSLELRELSKILHRFEISGTKGVLVFQNYKPKHHISMGNVDLPITISNKN